MTKSPLALARMALCVASESIPASSSKSSPRRYTQHQPFALPALREFLKVDHRGLEQILRGWAELRDVPGLAEVPDHSTIPGAAGRPLESGGPPTSFGGRCAARRRAA